MGLNIKGIDIKGIHYSNKGQEPSNILDKPKDTQEKILSTFYREGFERSKDHIESRRDLEKKLYAVAKDTLDKKNIRKHPIYFVVGENKDLAEGNISTRDKYTLDKSLLEKSTFTIGDSLATLKNKDDIEDKVYSYDELKDVLLNNKKDVVKDLSKLRSGDYIEGQLWVDHKIKGKSIKEASLNKEAVNIYTTNDEFGSPKMLNIDIKRHDDGLLSDVANHILEKHPPTKSRKRYRAALIGTGLSTAYILKNFRQLSPEAKDAFEEGMDKADTQQAKDERHRSLGTLGLGYYSFRNRDVKKKAIPAAIGAGLMFGVNSYLNRQPNFSFANYLKTDMSEPRMKIIAGLAGVTAGAIAMAHYGQRAEDDEKVIEHLQSDRPYRDIAHDVNTIREQKTLMTKYPLLRWFPKSQEYSSKVPKFITRFDPPSPLLKPEDEKVYHKNVTNSLLNRMVDKYEYEEGVSPSSDEYKLLHGNAYDLATDRINKQKIHALKQIGRK